MSLIVQKYGGTSLADVTCINKVADRILLRANQDQLVIVVSAMGAETNRLEKLASQVSKNPEPRELDVLFATGEQVSISLLTMALLARGIEAKSYLGMQIPILTDNVHTKARIMHIDVQKILAELSAGKVVVVAGFQGKDSKGNITTLGRGGSDATAVALASALKADECQIYTDVEGIFTTDPQIVPQARCMDKINIIEMLELAGLGAKVLQSRAVEFADMYNVRLRVLSSFKESSGTLVVHEHSLGDNRSISGIAFCKEETKIVIQGIPAKVNGIGRFLHCITSANIGIDMMIHSVAPNNFMNLTFTVSRNDGPRTKKIIQNLATKLGANVYMNDHVAKISLVGVGTRSRAKTVSKLFSTLEKVNIHIQLVASSEIKVSVLIDEKHLETGVKTLHESFGLNAKPAKVVY